jgi:hypothetical protein
MVAPNRWYSFIRTELEKIPEGLCGRYEIGDKDKVVVYPGSSASSHVGIRGRLISHLIHNRCSLGKYFRYCPEGILDDARAMERSSCEKAAKRQGNKPIYVHRIPRAKDNYFQGWI